MKFSLNYENDLASAHIQHFYDFRLVWTSEIYADIALEGYPHQLGHSLF
ncbi:hypothetical protein C900_00175 [Fulvivirga imtechensis AK7]|uniref:Uncharacterized protein n=1 Tax=Fulvivirga imtechensis AK7 TaxID=1237149 RepID=L8JIC9_9BACT|nr:hypothetical protein C900_00175 [Fulvivirga imtechensis AK7]